MFTHSRASTTTSTGTGGFAALKQQIAQYDITVLGGGTSLGRSVDYQNVGGDRGLVARSWLQGTPSVASRHGVALYMSSFVREAGADFRIGGKARSTSNTAALSARTTVTTRHRDRHARLLKPSTVRIQFTQIARAFACGCAGANSRRMPTKSVLLHPWT